MISKLILFPYYLGLKLRHFFYDRQIFGHKVTVIPGVPTICVGNITAGGTGKTPHTEMIIRLLQGSEEWGKKRIAVLSRGYKRKSKGYLEVSPEGPASLFGDEALQICRKFPEVTVAVDADRVEGCRKLVGSGKADVIILDDAFQHRKLKATLNILLINSRRPIDKDELLPVGRLRDLPSRVADADLVIVSKCDYEISGQEQSDWRKRILKYSKKPLEIFFTGVTYENLVPVYPDCDPRYLYSTQVILFSGIANDAQFRAALGGKYHPVARFSYPDHHRFGKRDMREINAAASSFPTAIIVTTEKDSERVLDCPYVCEAIRKRLFRIPIKVDFVNEKERLDFSDALIKSIDRI